MIGSGVETAGAVGTLSQRIAPKIVTSAEFGYRDLDHHLTIDHILYDELSSARNMRQDGLIRHCSIARIYDTKKKETIYDFYVKKPGEIRVLSAERRDSIFEELAEQVSEFSQLSFEEQRTQKKSFKSSTYESHPYGIVLEQERLEELFDQLSKKASSRKK